MQSMIESKTEKTETPKEVHFEMKSGSYEIQVKGKRSFLRVEKTIFVNNQPKVVVKFIQMESILVHLIHTSGDTVTIRKTTMGKFGKPTYSRLDNLPLEMIQNKEALGDAWIPKSKAPKSLKEDQAKAEIIRMTKCHHDDADTFLAYEGLVAAQ